MKKLIFCLVLLVGFFNLQAFGSDCRAVSSTKVYRPGEKIKITIPILGQLKEPSGSLKWASTTQDLPVIPLKYEEDKRALTGEVEVPKNLTKSSTLIFNTGGKNNEGKMVNGFLMGELRGSGVGLPEEFDLPAMKGLKLTPPPKARIGNFQIKGEMEPVVKAHPGDTVTVSNQKISGSFEVTLDKFFQRQLQNKIGSNDNSSPSMNQMLGQNIKLGLPPIGFSNDKLNCSIINGDSNKYKCEFQFNPDGIVNDSTDFNIYVESADKQFQTSTSIEKINRKLKLETPFDVNDYRDAGKPQCWLKDLPGQYQFKITCKLNGGSNRDQLHNELMFKDDENGFPKTIDLAPNATCNPNGVCENTYEYPKIALKNGKVPVKMALRTTVVPWPYGDPRKEPQIVTNVEPNLIKNIKWQSVSDLDSPSKNKDESISISLNDCNSFYGQVVVGDVSQDLIPRKNPSTDENRGSENTAK